MSVRLQPVLIQPSGPQDETVRAVFQQAETALRVLMARLGPETVLPTAVQLPHPFPVGEVVLWFVAQEEDEDIRAAVNQLSEQDRRRLILFGYWGDRALELLEETRVLGLVTENTVNNWMNNKDRRFYKMGQGHGLYGLRALFDDAQFDGAFRTLGSSPNYVLFYNADVHELDQLLVQYLQRSQSPAV